MGGVGLSYSNFASKISSAPASILTDQFSDDLTLSSLSKHVVAKVEVNTTNWSERDGSETVLLFLSSPNAGNDGEPIQSLVAFDKVHVPAYTSAVISLEIKA